MKTLKQITQNGITALALTAIFQSCSSVAPVTTSVESARLLEKGKIEGAVMYSNYKQKQKEFTNMNYSNGYISYDSETKMKTLNNNYGFRIVTGGKKANLGFHYERMVCPDSDLRVDYFSIEPKFRLNSTDKSASAFSVPVGIYVPQNDNAVIYQIMPSFLFTYGSSKYFEFSFSPKALFILNYFPKNPFINMTAGFGLSSDLSKWAIRPEIGYTVNTGGGNGILQTAVGLSLSF